jgi:hypothetical protein
MGGSPKISGGMTKSEQQELLEEERQYQKEQEERRRLMAEEDENRRVAREEAERQRVAAAEAEKIASANRAEQNLIEEAESLEDQEDKEQGVMALTFFEALNKGITTQRPI